MSKSQIAAGTILLSACLIAGMSCATGSSRSTTASPGETIIIDRPTPSGDVQPPREVTPVQPYRPSPPADLSGTETVANQTAIASSFRKAYAQKGNPRIALYVNRALSDDPREWQSNSRTTVGYGETQTKSGANGTSKTTTSGGVSVSQEVRIDDTGSRPVDQAWAWQLEDAVRAPLLNAGVQIIDREIILRLAAASEGHTAHEDLALKRLEMDALKGKADILAQIVISPSPDPKLGYIYRTEAYDVDSGRVITSTSSANWPASRRVKGVWVATQTGYEKTGMPDPQELGKFLAMDLMAGLSGGNR